MNASPEVDLYNQPDARDEFRRSDSHLQSVQGNADLLSAQSVTLDGTDYASPEALEQLDVLVQAAVRDGVVVAGDIDNPTVSSTVLNVARAGGWGMLYTRNPPGGHAKSTVDAEARMQELVSAGGAVVSLAKDSETPLSPQAYSDAVAALSHVVHVYESHGHTGPPMIAESAALNQQQVTVESREQIHDLDNPSLQPLWGYPPYVNATDTPEDPINQTVPYRRNDNIDAQIRTETDEFRERAQELRAAGRIDSYTRNHLLIMADYIPNLGELQGQINYGGLRVGAVEKRYLSSALDAPAGQRPETWDESAAWVRAFGEDQFRGTNQVHQIERDRGASTTQSFS